MYDWPQRAVNISRHDLMLGITEHANWLSGSLESNRLYLSYKDLRGISTLGGVNLTNTDFAESNCEGLVFRDCNLRHCNFIGANLTNASFIDCNLGYSTFLNANLSSINITNSSLYKAIGNGKEIKNFHLDALVLTYTSHVLQIDCIKKPLEWWRLATVEQLNELAEDPLLGEQLGVDWSGFMAPETMHGRIAILYQLIDSAPAVSSIQDG